MDSNILKEFLISIGYKVNDTSERNFVGSLAKITAATQVAAAGVVAGVAKMAQALDGLYWASRRAQTSADNLEAFGYQIAQMGGSADAAKASVERLGMSMRFNPGTQGLLHALGVQATDSAQAMEQLGAKFRAMSPVLAHAYAGAFGIDDRQLFSMLQGGGQYAEEYRRTRAQAGLSSANAAREGHNFNVLMNSFGVTLKTLRELSSVALMKGIGMDVQKLNELIRKHFSEISDVITKAGKIILGVGEGVWRLMWRLEQLWNGLDGWQRQLVMAFAGIITAWRLLNLAFLKSPLGIILLLAAAIALLYDDYMTWKNGGESLIDWGKWKPYIDLAIGGIHKIIEALGDLAAKLGMDGGVKGAFELLAAFVVGAWATRMILGITSVAAAAGATLIPRLSSILGLLGRIGGSSALRYLGPLGVLLAGMWPSSTAADDQINPAAPDADGSHNGRLPMGAASGNRPNWWQRHAPSWLGGGVKEGAPLPAPSRPGEVGQGLVEFVKQKEGFSGTASWDYHQWSNGYGTRSREGETIGREEAERRLRTELEASAGRVDEAARKAGITLTPAQRDALISFDFNTGAGPRVIAAAGGSPANIAAAMSRYVHAGGQVNQGLVNRRTDELRMFGSDSAPASGLDQRMQQLRRQVNAQALGNSAALANPAPIAPVGAGAAGAASGGNATISQNTTINVSGSGDPQQVANLVTSGQSRVNDNMVRNAKSAVAVQ